MKNNKVYYYNLYKIDAILKDLTGKAKLLARSFNLTFDEQIDTDELDDDKIILERLLNKLKDKFITLLLLDNTTNAYEIIPFIVLKTKTDFFIIYNNKNTKNENCFRTTLEELKYNIGGDKITPLKDHEIVSFNTQTETATYIYNKLLLINGNFNKITEGKSET
jgi:hypothetical protein